MNKLRIIQLLFIVTLLASIGLALEKTTGLCDAIDESGGCKLVESSKYSEFLGIKNYWFGILISIVLIALIQGQIQSPNKEKQQMIEASIFIGLAVSLYFIYIQKFVIGAYCKYCLVVDAALILIAIIYYFKKN